MAVRDAIPITDFNECIFLALAAFLGAVDHFTPHDRVLDLFRLILVITAKAGSCGERPVGFNDLVGI